jgi:hypothetical protein
MGQLSLTLLRLGFLVLLWVFVLMVVAVLRADIYGTRVVARGRGLADRRAFPTTTVAPARVSVNSKRAAPPDRPPSSLSHSLVVTDGPLVGTTIPLDGADVSIGRDPTSTLVVDDDFCSARHARVYLEDGEWWIEDLGSTNGTFLDDSRLFEPAQARPGTRIRLGSTELEVRG